MRMSVGLDNKVLKPRAPGVVNPTDANAEARRKLRRELFFIEMLKPPDKLPAIALSKIQNPVEPPPECYLPAPFSSLREFRIRDAARSARENRPVAAS